MKSSPTRPPKPRGWPIGLSNSGNEPVELDSGNYIRFMDVGGIAVPLSISGDERNDLNNEILTLAQAAKRFEETEEDMRALWMNRWGAHAPVPTGESATSMRWFEALNDPRISRRLAFYLDHIGNVPPADFLVAVLDVFNSYNEAAKLGFIACAMNFYGDEPYNFDAADGADAKGGAH